MQYNHNLHTLKDINTATASWTMISSLDYLLVNSKGGSLVTKNIAAVETIKAETGEQYEDIR